MIQKLIVIFYTNKKFKNKMNSIGAFKLFKTINFLNFKLHNPNIPYHKICINNKNEIILCELIV